MYHNKITKRKTDCTLMGRFPSRNLFFEGKAYFEQSVYLATLLGSLNNRYMHFSCFYRVGGENQK